MGDSNSVCVGIASSSWSLQTQGTLVVPGQCSTGFQVTDLHGLCWYLYCSMHKHPWGQRLASIWLLSSPKTPSAILWKSCHVFEGPFGSKEKVSTAYRISHLSLLLRSSIISSIVLNCWQNRRLLLSALQNLVRQRRTKSSNYKLEMWERKITNVFVTKNFQ